MRKIIRWSALILLLHTGMAAAQGPPIWTDTAIISGIEGAAVRSFVEVIQMSNAAADLSVTAVPLMVPYELLPNRVLVVAAIPYLDKTLDRKGMGTLSVSGLGDLNLLTKISLVQRDAFFETLRITFTGGIKLPTGEDQEPGIPRTLQLGSGSTDYAAGMTGTYVHNRIGISGDLLYTFKTDSHDFELGDTLQYDLAFGYRLLPVVYKSYPAKQLNLYLELNGTVSQRNEMNGAKVADSGGHLLYLSPGIQFIPGRTFLMEASYQIPVLKNLNGAPIEPDYTVLLGFRWLIL